MERVMQAASSGQHPSHRQHSRRRSSNVANALPYNQGYYRRSFNNKKIAPPEYFEGKLCDDQYRRTDWPLNERYSESGLREDQYRGTECPSTEKYLEGHLREDQYRGTEAPPSERYLEGHLREDQYRGTEAPSSERNLEGHLREDQYRGAEAPSSERYLEAHLREDQYQGKTCPSTARFFEVNPCDDLPGATEWHSTLKYKSPPTDEQDTDPGLDPNGGYFTKEYMTKKNIAAFKSNWMGGEKVDEVKRASPSDTSNRAHVEFGRVASEMTISKKLFIYEENSPKLEEAKPDSPSAEAQEIFLKGIRECERHRFNFDEVKKQWKIDEVVAAVAV